MDEIAKSLSDFGARKEGGAFVLHGAWGVGKTHFWKEVVKPEVMRKPWFGKYSYVTLFGINSLPDLKTALAVASEEWNRGAEAASWNKQDAIEKKHYIKATRVWLTQKIQPHLVNAAQTIPKAGDAIARAIALAGFYRVRNRLICFDDIERKGAGLSMRDFLGMISYLTEECNCRVVVLLNKDALPTYDMEEWHKSWEKVFQGSIQFKPTPDYACNIALNNSAERPWKKDLHDAFVQLKVSNIRLINRAAYFLNLIESRLPNSCHALTWQRAARSVAVLVFSVHGIGNDGPPIGVVMGNKSSSAESSHWDSLMQSMGLKTTTKLEECILNMIETGIVPTSDLQNAIESHNNQVQYSARSKSFNEAWDSFRSTLANNPQSVLTSIQQAWPPVSSEMSISYLRDTVRLVRAAGDQQLATTFIDTWIAERSGERYTELTTRLLEFLDEKIDRDIRERISQVAMQETKSDEINLEDALSKMINKSSTDRKEFKAILAADAASIAEKLQELHSPKIADSIIYTLSLWGGDDNESTAARKLIVDALTLIASQSDFTAYRIREMFGIDAWPQMTQSG